MGTLTDRSGGRRGQAEAAWTAQRDQGLGCLSGPPFTPLRSVRELRVREAERLEGAFVRVLEEFLFQRRFLWAAKVSPPQKQVSNGQGLGQLVQ